MIISISEILWCSPGSFTVYQVIWNDPGNKNIYDLWAGISTHFKIFEHFMFKGGQDQTWSPWITYQLMPLDARNNNIYCLRVRILTIFEIFRHFLLKWVRTTYGANDLHAICCSLTQEQEYTWFRGQDPNYFWDIWSFLIPGGGDGPRGQI